MDEVEEIGVTLMETVVPAGGSLEGYVLGLPANGDDLSLRFTGRESVTRIRICQHATDLWQPRADPVEHCTRHCDRWVPPGRVSLHRDPRLPREV